MVENDIASRYASSDPEQDGVWPRMIGRGKDDVEELREYQLQVKKDDVRRFRDVRSRRDGTDDMRLNIGVRKSSRHYWRSNN